MSNVPQPQGTEVEKDSVEDADAAGAGAGGRSGRGGEGVAGSGRGAWSGVAAAPGDLSCARGSREGGGLGCMAL